MFATLLSQQTYCSWCGKDDAPMQCHCRRVNYCNEQCQREAFRAEHRLTCPSAKPSSRFTKGSLLRIHGLESQAGRRMNGKLAEMVQVQNDTGRIQVMLNLDDKINVVNVKRENLTLELSMVQASQRAVQSERELQELLDTMTPAGDDAILEYQRYADRLPSMNAEEIMQSIREYNCYLLQAIQSSDDTLALSTLLEVFELGLVDLFLDRMSFPDAVDNFSLVLVDPRYLPILLVTVFRRLLREGRGSAATEKWRNVMMEKAWPIILSMSTKKRRFYNSTHLWHTIQFPLLGWILQLLEGSNSI